jgi:microcystin degradation protein MlrC
MRLVAGGISHETHTFSNTPATLQQFLDAAWPGKATEMAGTNTSIGGVIDACRELGIDLTVALVAGAAPSGMPSRETFEALLGRLLEDIAAALQVDGVVLTLHGAMVAEGYPDAEGEIARRVREIVGSGIPVAITLDLHANISQEMVDASDIVVGYDTYPHIDAAERAREAVGLLVATVEGRIRPVMALVKPPLLPVPQAMFTAREPMAALFRRAFELEASSDALSITVAGGFPYSDVPVAGMSMLAVTDNDAGRAREIARELASMAWDRREEFAIRNVPPRDAVAQAIAHPGGPVILVDIGDNIGGGTPGDGTVLLRELLDQRAQDATIVIADSEAVREAFAAGIGGTLDTQVGGKSDDLHGEPAPIHGIVRLLCDGRWVHDGPENAGVPTDMGPSAVVRVEGVNLILTTVKCAPGDLQQLKSVGVDPERQHIIVVKAAVRWRGGYEPIMAHSIDVDTPGLGSVDLSRFEFRHLRRPIYPLDAGVRWE